MKILCFETLKKSFYNQTVTPSQTISSSGQRTPGRTGLTTNVSKRKKAAIPKLGFNHGGALVRQNKDGYKKEDNRYDM